jgi:hypothetical protein
MWGMRKAMYVKYLTKVRAGRFPDVGMKRLLTENRGDLIFRFIFSCYRDIKEESYLQSIIRGKR